jgi:hypothetical protein
MTELYRSIEAFKKQRRLWAEVEAAASKYVDYAHRHGWMIRLKLLEEPDTSDDDGDVA